MIIGAESTRYRFIFSNVLNFTGVACLLYALLSCRAIFNRQISWIYIAGTAIFLVLGVLSASKSMLLSALLSIVLVLCIWKKILLVIILLLCSLVYTFYSDKNLGIDAFSAIFSLSDAAIDHRLARYGRLFDEMSFMGIGLQALPSICKELYDTTCVNSESYLISNIISFGIIGLVQVCILIVLIMRRLYIALHFLAPLFTNSLGTPYTLLVLYTCLFFITRSRSFTEK